MAQKLTLNVLGSFEARLASGELLDLPSRKARALLTFLAVEGERAHSRERLAGLLWGGVREDRARHNLRQALSKIRQCLGGVLTAGRDTVAISSDACVVDALEFQRLARSREPADLVRCLALYRGELSAGASVRAQEYEDWLLVARARLARIACETADRLVEHEVRAGRPEDAIRTLERRLTLDSAFEPAHRQLIELLAAVGRRSDALRQFQRCKEALARDLGTTPSPETVALYETVRRASGEAGPAASGAGPERDQSLAQPLPTVAVLPFANLSGAQDDYFVDGVVEDITTALSCFHSLAVIARGSAFRFRDESVGDARIAAELGAQYLVRGSVQRSPRQVRVNVQLLDTGSGVSLWAHRFDRELEDVFLVQDEIAATVASTLAGRVEAARLAQARRAPPERLEAYDYVLRGKDHHHRFTPADCGACLELFERAIERDPDYAVAYAWLACGIGQALVFELGDPADLVSRSEAACQRGLELDENEAECHRVLAQVMLSRRNLARAVWHQERALFLNPNDDRSVCCMGEFHALYGRHEEAERWVRRSMALNPFHPERYWTHLARPLFHLGRYRECLDALEHVSRLRRDDHVYRVAASEGLGDPELVATSLCETREAFPELDLVGFASSIPYQEDADRRALVGMLEKALRRAGRVAGSTSSTPASDQPPFR